MDVSTRFSSLRLYRRALRDRTATALIVLLIAAGIGPNVVLVALAQAALIRPIPYRNPESLVVIYKVVGSNTKGLASAAEFARWSDLREVFDSVAAFSARGFVFTGPAFTDRLQAAAVSASFFSVLGGMPEVGQAHVDPSSVVLSDRLWSRQYQRREDIVNTPLVLGGRSYLIAGIMPPAFRFPVELYPGWEDVALWVPLQQDRQDDSYIYAVIARLRDGVTAQQAQRRLVEIDGEGRAYRVNRLSAEVVGDSGMRLALLAVVGACVLLAACLNVANLMLMRGERTRRETVISMALGATRGRLVGAAAFEAMAVALGGAALGIASAAWAIDMIPALLPRGFPNADSVTIDSLLLIGTLLAALAATASAIVPVAWSATSAPLAEVLRQDGGGTVQHSGGRHVRLRRRLLSAQIAIAGIVAAGAGIALSRFSASVMVPAGFDAQGVVTARIPLTARRATATAGIGRFYEAVAERFASIPEVAAAAVSTGRPGVWAEHDMYGLGTPPDEKAPRLFVQAVSPSYFDVMRIRRIAGELFTKDDIASVVVDTAMASRLGGPHSAIGRSIYIGRESVPRTIVGVVGTVHLFGGGADALPQAYISIHNTRAQAAVAVIRSKTGTVVPEPALRVAMRDVDFEQPIDRIVTLSRAIQVETAQIRLSLLYFGLLSALSVLVAVAGTYALVAYQLSLQIRELGVRACLGATPRVLFVGVLVSNATPIIAGTGLALLGAAATIRLLPTGLSEVKIADIWPATWPIVAVAAAALLAAIVATRKVIRTDPVDAIRQP